MGVAKDIVVAVGDKCIVCGKDITDLHPNAKTCKGCKIAKDKIVAVRTNTKQKEDVDKIPVRKRSYFMRKLIDLGLTVGYNEIINGDVTLISGKIIYKQAGGLGEKVYISSKPALMINVREILDEIKHPENSKRIRDDITILIISD